MGQLPKLSFCGRGRSEAESTARGAPFLAPSARKAALSEVEGWGSSPLGETDANRGRIRNDRILLRERGTTHTAKTTVEAWRFSATIEPAKTPASAAVARHAEPEHCPLEQLSELRLRVAVRLNPQREIKMKLSPQAT
jgi:hypothetical protein